MAKLKKLPSTAIINGFKGTIDFYVWRGIPCARKWPSPPQGERSPGVQATWPAFSWAAHYWVYLPLSIKEAYNQLAVSTNMTGRDLFLKSFINGSSIYLEDV